MWPHLDKATKANGVPALPNTFPVALGKVHVAETWPGCPNTSEMLNWGPQVLTWKTREIVPLCSACLYRKEWEDSASVRQELWKYCDYFKLHYFKHHRLKCLQKQTRCLHEPRLHCVALSGTTTDEFALETRIYIFQIHLMIRSHYLRI